MPIDPTGIRIKRTEMANFSDPRRKRLLFQSKHRGMQENDLLLGRFAEGCLGELTPEQLDWFEALLAEADNDLLKWIIGREPVPDEHDTPLFQMIIDFNKAK